MANNNLGSIYYTVKAETGELIQAEKAVQRSIRETDAALKSADASIARHGANMTKTASGVNSALGGMGRSAGQAGIQLQQLIGQVQGGQSALLALSQQSADLGIVLGAPLLGAIVGIGASMAGILIPAFINSAKSVEDLQQSIERYTAVVTLSKNGNAEFTKSLQEIASRSRVVAGELSNIAAARAMMAASEAAKTVKDQIGDFGSIFGETFGSLSSKLGLTRQQLGALQGSINALQKGVTTERLDAFEKQISNIGMTGGRVSAETLDLKESLLTLSDNMRLSIGVVDALKTKHDDFGNSVDESKSNLDDLISTMALQATTIGMTERELALYMARLSGATEADLAAIDAIARKIEAYKAEEEAQKARTQALKDYEAETMRQLEAEENLRKQGTDFARSKLRQGMSEPERIAADLEKIKELHAQELITTELFEAAKTSLQQQEADARKKIADDEMRARMAQQNAILSSTSQFFGAAADLIGQAAGEQSAAYRIMYGISKGFAIAQAILNLQTAISNASALPWPVNIPAMASAAASGASLVSNIQGLAYGGGRLYGGNVNPGTMYPVNENGRPEMFTDGNRQYLMPNTRGEVISNKDATSAGGGLNVYNNIVNNSGAQVTSTSRVEGEGTNRKLIIDTIVSDIKSGGATRRAITDATTAKNRTL